MYSQAFTLIQSSRTFHVDVRLQRRARASAWKAAGMRSVSCECLQCVIRAIRVQTEPSQDALQMLQSLRQRSSLQDQADSTSPSGAMPNNLDTVCDAAIAAVRADPAESTGAGAHSWHEREILKGFH